MDHQQLSWTQRGQLWLRLSIRLIGTLLVGGLVIKFGGRLLSLFMPFILAWFAAAALNPAVRQLQRRLKLNRKWSSLLVLIVFVGGVVTVLTFLLRAAVQEIVGLVENWGGLLAGLEQLAVQAEQMLQGILDKLPGEIQIKDETILNRVLQWLLHWLEGAIPDAAGMTAVAAEGARAVTGFALGLVVFLMGFYFLSADFPYLRARMTGHMNEHTLSWLRQMKRVSLGAFGGYLKAQLLLSVGVFFILLCGFLVMGQNYALLLALGFAVLDFIPLIGSGTVMIPWAIIDLFLGNYREAMALGVIWGLVALFRRLAEPKVVGDQTGLDPILSLMGIYVGMRLYGVLGMILGPILLLVVLNLAGLGLFDGVWADLRRAAQDISAILKVSREND